MVVDVCGIVVVVVGFGVCGVENELLGTEGFKVFVSCWFVSYVHVSDEEL